MGDLNMSKKENEVVISFNGNQSEEVVGSNVTISYLTETGRKTILVELGMIQNNDMADEYILNKEMLNNIPIKNSDYCFMVHLHSDHIALFPALSSMGFKGRIITTKTNAILSKPMLQDTIKLHMKSCQYLRDNRDKFKKKIKGKVKELFGEKDLDNTMNMMNIYDLDTIYQLDDCLSFRFTNNSHIIGATQLELFIKKYGSNVTKKLVFTSDLGNTDNYSYTYFTEPTIPVSNANVLCIESTYGLGDRNFNKRLCIEERKQLEKDILGFLNYNYSCMIPCFALSRLANMMCWLYDTFKDRWDMSKPIIIATNLGKKINNKMYEVLDDEYLAYWDEVMHWKPFKFISDGKSCEAFISNKPKSYLVLSSSGMISGGFSNLFAKQMLQDSHNGIIFCGYCSPNTIGGQLLDDNFDTVNIDGEILKKRCIVKRYYSFSSHASQKDLLNYIKQCNCQQVILQHGSSEAKEELKKLSEIELSKINRTTKVISSYKDMQITL
jgi:metallo-beta-lactamase family protein